MMKLYLTISLLISLLASDAAYAGPGDTGGSSTDTMEKINAEYDWSGYASYTSRSRSQRADGHDYASEKSASSSEYQMRAILSRGFGTATSSLIVNESNARAEWYTGKKTSGGYTVNGQARGSSATDIVVEFSEEENGETTYSIFIPIPACSGKSVKTSHDGQVTESEIGQDEGLIQIEYQPLGPDPNVIKGEIVTKDVNALGEETETVLEWSFIKGPLDVELIVSPEDYATWLPRPGFDEHGPGATLNIALKLQGKGGGIPKIKAKSFLLKLVNTSREPGVTINYPLVASENSLPDLRFLGEAGIHEGQELSLHPTDGISGEAVLAAYDGGGYTTLEVEALLEGGFRLTGKLDAPETITQIRIPKRRNDSRIAEHWFTSHAITAQNDQWDSEASMGNRHTGDGLSLYQEYRGVIASGKFKRLDPKHKELGVRMAVAQIPELQPGLDLFEAASGVKVIAFYESEIPESRLLNGNRSAGQGRDQYGQHLMIGPLPGDTVGENRPVHVHHKTPKRSELTIVDIPKIKGFYEAQRQAFEAAGVPPLYTETDEIANTIAHELAHGVGVGHHGENSNVIPRTAVRNFNPPYALFDTYGGPLDIPEAGLPLIKGVGDKKSNESSGDLNCIMAYTTRYTWYFEQAPDRTLVYRMVPPLPQGKKFCTSGKGTGINATGFFGDSVNGNCLGQVKVKDE